MKTPLRSLPGWPLGRSPDRSPVRSLSQSPSWPMWLRRALRPHSLAGLPVLLCLLALSGCASAPPPAPDAGLFHDELFAPAGPDISAAQIFTLSPAMQRYAREEIASKQHGKDMQQALFDALYRKDQLKLEYDSSMTRNAAQTFEARAGNCLSLVIMTAALAREVNLSVQYQRVAVDDSWSRSGSLYVSSGHVNLVLGKPTSEMIRSYDRNQYMTIDFQPPPEGVRQVVTLLDEATVVAMYMNNRAAEALAGDRADEAYWWARKAIEQDSRFLNAYNTLGVVYQHRGRLNEAEQVLRYAQQREPDNTIFLFNLAQTLSGLGRNAEAAILKEKLARLEPYPPFYFFNLGQQAMQAGDYVRARDLFARELDREPYYHEFHFWLAAAAFRLGDLKTADRHMKLALENSSTRGQHELYAAKFDRLKALEARALHQ